MQNESTPLGLAPSIARLARLAVTTGILCVDMLPGEILDVIADEIRALLRAAGRAIPTAGELAELTGVTVVRVPYRWFHSEPGARPSAPLTCFDSYDVRDGRVFVYSGAEGWEEFERMTTASGMAVLLSLGIAPERLLEPAGIGVAEDLGRRILVPSSVVDEIFGEPRAMYEDRAEDLAHLDAVNKAIIHRTGVTEDMARDRVNDWLTDQVGDWWHPATEAAAE